MPLYYNGTQVKKLTYNGIEVKSSYYNEVNVFSSEPEWITLVENGIFIINPGYSTGVTPIDGYLQFQSSSSHGAGADWSYSAMGLIEQYPVEFKAIYRESSSVYKFQLGDGTPYSYSSKASIAMITAIEDFEQIDTLDAGTLISLNKGVFGFNPATAGTYKLKLKSLYVRQHIDV